MVRCMLLSNSSSALSLSLLRYLLLDSVCCCRSTGNQVLHFLKAPIDFFMFFSGEKPLERGRMKISLLGVMKELGRKNRVLPSDLELWSSGWIEEKDNACSLSHGSSVFPPPKPNGFGPIRSLLGSGPLGDSELQVVANLLCQLLQGRG